MDKTINKKHPTAGVIKTPAVECLECKLFLAFMKCFGLTFADVKTARLQSPGNHLK